MFHVGLRADRFGSWAPRVASPSRHVAGSPEGAPREAELPTLRLTASRSSQLNYGSLVITQQQLCCLFLLHQSINFLCVCSPSIAWRACALGCLFLGVLNSPFWVSCAACLPPTTSSFSLAEGSNSAVATSRWRKTFVAFFNSNHTRSHMQQRANTHATHKHTQQQTHKPHTTHTRTQNTHRRGGSSAADKPPTVGASGLTIKIVADAKPA